MPDKQSKIPHEALASQDVRSKALELLRSQGWKALRDVEKMLGWESNFGMINYRMATQLGIKEHQLKYLLYRRERQEEGRQRRKAKKAARDLELTTYTSSKLKFVISYPVGWTATTDALHTESEGVDVEKVYEAFKKELPNFEMTLEEFRKEVEEPEYEKDLSAEEAYKRLLDREGDDVVSFPEFKKIFEQDLLQRKQTEEKMAQLAQMELGLFHACPPDSEDDVNVEVAKLSLSRPMTAMELYELHKPPYQWVPIGNRPSKGIDVDGLYGVKYYYIFNTGETDKMWEMPKFFNVYLVENDEGWIISCSCIEMAFINHKPIFERIIDSFRRI